MSLKEKRTNSFKLDSEAKEALETKGGHGDLKWQAQVQEWGNYVSSKSGKMSSEAAAERGRCLVGFKGTIGPGLLRR